MPEAGKAEKSAMTNLLLALLLALPTQANSDGEEIPAGEAEATAQVTALIRKGVSEEHAKNGHAFRDAHRKAHGCVKAKFSVAKDLPADLAVGVFAGGREYDSIIRFSNGSGGNQDDKEGDGRGMAVKLLGVEGKKLLADEPDAGTQDFLMINHPVFFVEDAEQYVGFQEAVSSGTASFLWWLTTHPRLAWIAKKITGKEMNNPLNSRYWSMTASKLGPKQMKFSAAPCEGSKFIVVSNSFDLLRDNLEAHLAAENACFDFKVQLRTNASMPIEDPTVEWEESEAPFVTVAKISIPRQKVVQGEACEILSYTPWHSLPEHRPLGGISRVRKVVYEEISKLRHELNDQPRKEP